ncbi:MAG: M20/M25/M40 family metallo-hydrolase [Myxococcaceae bacterium]
MNELPLEIHEEAIALLRSLIRIDTTNPPGNERAAAELIAESLRKDHVEPRLFSSEKERPNLIARLRGGGEKGPLLITAHLDVVEAEASRWRHPPFAAEVEDGWLYGRGAVDMKNMAAMCTLVMRQLAREKVKLKRDLIFAAVADEEAGCTLGSKFLVDHHADEVRAEFALGELGGFTQELRGKRLYPIQVAQKGMVWIKARMDGTPGHGSMPREDNPVVALSALLAKLTPDALPIHATAPARRFIKAMAREQPALARVMMPLLLHPLASDRLLRSLPDRGVARAMSAILRNTVSPTVVRAGNKTNVIPSFAEAQLDGRTLPGQNADSLLKELRELVGEDVKLEVMRSLDPVESSPDTLLFGTLAEAIRKMDPEGVAVPYIIPGFTDAEPFSKLGVTYYGFAPIRFPAEPRVAFSELYHSDNERIPLSGFSAGLDALYFAVRRFCEA